VLPTLYAWQAYLPAFDADPSISATRYANIETFVNTTIAALESSALAPELSDFKTVDIVSSTPLDINRVQLTAAATDLDGGVPRYLWSRVSGPGNVTFSQNGTTTSASTVATFDLPGTYLLRVSVVDDSILNAGVWTKPVLGYVDFKTYEHDYAPVTADATVELDPETNWPPVAYGQSVITGIDTPRALTLVASDYNGDALSYAITTPPEHGTLSGTAPGLTYTPDPGYQGLDSFSYVASDGGGLSSPAATVGIEVRNALVVHVNFYASSGPAGNQVPQDPATLVGPAGGLGKTWNQFNTASASGLSDSAGAATSVGFTNNASGGWIWGNPVLSKHRRKWGDVDRLFLAVP